MIIVAICLASLFPYTRAFYEDDVSVYELLYGDLTNLENTFVLPFNTSVKREPDPELKPERRRPFGEMLEKLEEANEILDVPNQGYDVHDFNAISIELRNLTRKRIYAGKRYEYDEDDYYTKGVHERKKKMMLLMANVQFLIHTRYKVAMAVKLRDVVKWDKRYKLGYLFAKLRRLLTAQRKMVASAEGNRQSYYHHNLYVLMRLYEKVVRLDVDMRDTIAMIKGVFGEKAVVDKLY